MSFPFEDITDEEFEHAWYYACKQDEQGDYIKDTFEQIEENEIDE